MYGCPLCTYELYRHTQVSLATPDGNPLFCGGYRTSRDCWQFIPENNSWIAGPPELLGSRFESASVQLGNGSHWVVDSANYPDYFTSEILTGEGDFVPGPDTPGEIEGY